mmetsp:Transcript_1435/g.3465  ORF Transcript_1435/g.3465 Transcript_1435/m.3465 type:complete len:267 (-) Transcript_1435:1518-2318(-)
MYSLMSMRTIASSVLNRNEAKAFASSVLPTPVGPRNMKDAIGLLGSDKPARLLWMESDTAITASFCPITRLCSSSGRYSSFSRSPSTSLDTGMPVHLEMISAMSASVTSSFSSLEPPSARAFCASASSAALSCLFSSNEVPYFSSAARFRSYSRSAAAISKFTRSISSFRSWTRLISRFSACHFSVISVWSFFSCDSSRSSSDSLDLAALSLGAALFRDRRSISNCSTFLSTSSSTSGLLVISILSLAAASSTRSMALSGRNLSAM